MPNRRMFLAASAVAFGGAYLLSNGNGRSVEVGVGEWIGPPSRDIWTKGYTQAQLDEAQEHFGLKFPPDLVDLYREKRPVDAYDWTRDFAKIREMMANPLEGLWFDVQHNALWLPDWGGKPSDPKDQYAILKSAIDAAPKQIPIISHRYLPEEPHEAGNPVFSVVQSDIIYYGSSIEDYFQREFHGYTSRPYPSEFKRIRFWSMMVERNS